MRLRVNSLTGRSFRRNGIDFTGAPVVIDTAELKWTEQQVENLMSAAAGKGAALHVENVDAPPTPPPDLEPSAPTTTTRRGR